VCQPFSGRHACAAVECARKRRSAGIAGLGGHRLDRPSAQKEILGEVQAPSGQLRHRRDFQHLWESLGKPRARHARFLGECLQCPRALRLLVQRSQAAGEAVIA
jgi:hypothetical protein